VQGGESRRNFQGRRIVKGLKNVGETLGGGNELDGKTGSNINNDSPVRIGKKRGVLDGIARFGFSLLCRGKDEG